MLRLQGMDSEPSEAGDQTSVVHQQGSNEKDPPEDEDIFHGTCFYGRIDGRSFSVRYKTPQLKQSVYPDLRRVLRKLKFDVLGNDSTNIVQSLLPKVLFGGSISFNMPKSRIRPTLEKQFRKERKLVRKIMDIVFNKEANVPDQWEVTPIEEVAMGIRIDSTSAIRDSTTIFHAIGNDPDDEYRVIIEGQGNEGAELNNHVFHFDPSRDWINRRYHHKYHASP